MPMRRSSIPLLLSLAVLGNVAAGFAASEDEESPLAQQILVSVQNYRRTSDEMKQMQQALQSQSGVKDVMDFPTLQEFMRDSLNPAYRQLKDLFGRYQEDYGVKTLNRLATKYNFADLLARAEKPA